MDWNRIVGGLPEEHSHLEEAIISLERLARGQGRRRGRRKKAE
jgi:hypothetical protein